jgi:DNA-binding SARP family transcriptional activator
LEDPVRRSAGLAEALGLWRGKPLEDVTTEEIRARLCAGIEEERRTALEDRIEADLAAGRQEQLVPELAELVAAEPLRERLVIAWMTALYPQVTCLLASVAAKQGRIDDPRDPANRRD